jgi:hypothetical protein
MSDPELETHQKQEIFPSSQKSSPALEQCYASIPPYTFMV